MAVQLVDPFHDLMISDVPLPVPSLHSLVKLTTMLNVSSSALDSMPSTLNSSYTLLASLLLFSNPSHTHLFLFCQTVQLRLYRILPH